MVDKVEKMAKAIVVKGKVKKEEKTLTFATDDKTRIQKAGKDVPLADLKKDMQVSVETKKEGQKMERQKERSCQGFALTDLSR